MESEMLWSNELFELIKRKHLGNAVSSFHFFLVTLILSIVEREVVLG